MDADSQVTCFPRMPLHLGSKLNTKCEKKHSLINILSDNFSQHLKIVRFLNFIFLLRALES